LPASANVRLMGRNLSDAILFNVIR